LIDNHAAALGVPLVYTELLCLQSAQLAAPHTLAESYVSALGWTPSMPSFFALSPLGDPPHFDWQSRCGFGCTPSIYRASLLTSEKSLDWTLSEALLITGTARDKTNCCRVRRRHCLLGKQKAFDASRLGMWVIGSTVQSAVTPSVYTLCRNCSHS